MCTIWTLSCSGRWIWSLKWDLNLSSSTRIWSTRSSSWSCTLASRRMKCSHSSNSISWGTTNRTNSISNISEETMPAVHSAHLRDTSSTGAAKLATITTTMARQETTLRQKTKTCSMTLMADSKTYHREPSTTQIITISNNSMLLPDSELQSESGIGSLYRWKVRKCNLFSFLFLSS